jgi:tetratricopeptide (TPR) repeat protein
MATGNLDSPPGKDPVEELTEYVRLFPSSRYAQWVKLGVLWVKKARAGDDPDAVQAARANMEKEAPQFTNPMDAMCWYEAGIAAYRLGDEAGANANFNRAIAVDKQVFAREQVERVKRGEAYIRRLKAKDKEPTQESLKPIPQEDREAINNAIRQYFEAFGNGQLSQCKQMMTDDFKRGSSMDRERALKEMDEDLQKLKGRKLSIDPQIESMDTTDGTNINVQVRVIYHIADSQEAHRVALVMRKATGRWQIRTWNAVKMTRAEDDMGTGR